MNLFIHLVKINSVKIIKILVESKHTKYLYKSYFSTTRLKINTIILSLLSLFNKNIA
jgi:hypothetical protein